MVLGMETGAFHALTLIPLTRSGAHDFYSPSGRQGQPAVRGIFRYYAVKPSGKETKNATMRHLVWETVPVSGNYV